MRFYSKTDARFSETTVDCDCRNGMPKVVDDTKFEGEYELCPLAELIDKLCRLRDSGKKVGLPGYVAEIGQMLDLANRAHELFHS